MALTNVPLNYSNETCNILDNSKPVQVTKLFLFLVILVFGLVGNTLIIIIVYQQQELRKTTNYLIVNMAVSDFAYPLQAIPYSVALIASSSWHWPIGGAAGSILCKLGYYLRHVSSTVSVLSLVWITLDRFVAVVLPTKVHLISSKFRFLAIASTWIMAMTVNFVDFYAYNLINENQIRLCVITNSTPSMYITFIRVRFVLLIVPFIVMTISYSVTILTLRRQDKVLHHTQSHQVVKRKRRAIRMSICIMIAFYICFLPMLFLSLALLEMQMTIPCWVLKELSFFAYLMFYLSSTINPIICMAFAKRYRRGLAQIVRSFWSHLAVKGNYNIESNEEVSPRKQLEETQATATRRKRENAS